MHNLWGRTQNFFLFLLGGDVTTKGSIGEVAGSISSSLEDGECRFSYEMYKVHTSQPRVFLVFVFFLCFLCFLCDI